MKVKHILILSLLAAFAIVLFYGLNKILPAGVTIEKPVAIGDSISSVFEKINNAKNWDQWMAWLSSDTIQKKIYFGAEEGEGAGMQWSESETIPAGKFVMLKSNFPDSIQYEMSFKDYGTAYGSILFRKYSKGTYLSWSFRLDSCNGFVKRYKLIGFRNEITELIELSQQYLKRICEYEASHHIDMNYTDLPECDYLFIRDECFAPEISDRMSRHFSDILQYISQKKIKQDGFPFCIYHKVSDTMVFSVCIPVIKSDNVLLQGNIKAGHLDPVMSVVANYHGDYSSLGNAHAALQQWITEGGKKISGDPLEMYVTGPAEVLDSSRWLTKIYYPVE